ncbi:unnamed protein product [Vitrella brassicaformis CCMP3155]|uniref:Trafficking protein particle complex subunit n=2 Tax=Vitrella brassicaformis TaxID=1169539 RepID=A0A0G4GM74_VITBC|nr:unnamed protein product [Vitrella brassicaformis CCMP3155]|mmetsp:Transcript_40037/g.100175  ORF Transcript_40037/g.100175 Transcript_40037/m.100175 type:complete len:187 (+) Transcript_40037:104-664(+)|eukprot:CEM31165.1 unnamed protein product [Vitrella brassicaformis CCMP3155]
MSRQHYLKAGEVAFSKMDKVSAELLALTYGSLVTQLLKDKEEIESVNVQLEKMGYNIGIRLVDEFLAKSGIGPCQDFRDTAEVIAKVALKMFLNVTADVTGWNSDLTACTLVLHDNPLNEFVELPASMAGLKYGELICGVIRGGLEQVHMRVSCTFVKDVLKGDDTSEIALEFKEILKEEFVDEDE